MESVANIMRLNGTFLIYALQLLKKKKKIHSYNLINNSVFEFLYFILHNIIILLYIRFIYRNQGIEFMMNELN